MKRLKAYIAILQMLQFLVPTACLELGEQCQTPSKVNGKCIDIPNCPALVKSLEPRPLPSHTLDLLRKSLCGFVDIEPLVCCPSSLPSGTKSTPKPPSFPSGTSATTKEPSFQSGMSSATKEPSTSSRIGSTSKKPPRTEATEDVSRHKNLGLLKKHLCGPISDYFRIHRDTGNRTRLFEFPWMALIGYNDPSGTPYKCVGSIINERYILTAAHCVKFLPGNYRPLGEHNLESDIDCEDYFDGDIKEYVCAPAPQDFDIEEIIPHPSYIGRPNHEYDIALVRLSRPANFNSDSVHPICLPIGLPRQRENFDRKPLVVSGWTATDKTGQSPVLLKARITGVSLKDCVEAYKNLATISPISQVCASIEGEGLCLGDAGSPLTYYGLMNGKRKAVQHGIVSFSFRNCDSPVVYTRVGHFMKWILDNMKP